MQRNLERALTWEGVIRRKQRHVIEGYRTHHDPRVRELAETLLEDGGSLPEECASVDDDLGDPWLFETESWEHAFQPEDVDAVTSSRRRDPPRPRPTSRKVTQVPPRVPASDGPLKVTVRIDASFDYRTGIAGVGLIVHETRQPEQGRQGPIVAELAEAHVGVAAGDVEAFAILRALEVAQARGAALVRIRSHNNQLRHRLMDDHRAGQGLEREDLRGRILRLARAFVGVQFSYQQRRKSQDARRLARAARALSPITFGRRPT